ncbi:Transcription factor bHLH84 [Hordeum vulgare]|nr:Transcription factor bHLH84 [Hordeum vulgare]
MVRELRINTTPSPHACSAFSAPRVAHANVVPPPVEPAPCVAPLTSRKKSLEGSRYIPPNPPVPPRPLPVSAQSENSRTSRQRQLPNPRKAQGSALRSADKHGRSSGGGGEERRGARMKSSPAMDPEAAVAQGTPPENTEGRRGEGKKRLPWRMTLSLAYQSLGVVYGDLSTTISSNIYCSDKESDCSEGNRGEEATVGVVCIVKARAGRGPASNPQNLRREKINDKLRVLQKLVPNGTKVDLSTMLEEAVLYVKFLKLQIKVGNEPESNLMFWEEFCYFISKKSESAIHELSDSVWYSWVSLISQDIVFAQVKYEAKYEAMKRMNKE